jgi:magnesium-transporting ATPase (P-type)
LIASEVTTAFFDKTGTLTKQGLDFISVRSAESWGYGTWTSEIMAFAMGVCHSLTISKSGTLIGTPVDKAMFHAAGAKLVDASGETAVVNIKGVAFDVLRRFEFDHVRMTQSVIVRKPDGTITVFVKGSGESVSAMCNPESVPETFKDRLRDYSRIGVYQITMATKDLDLGEDSETEIASLTRDQVEHGLQFIGVLNFQNVMREDTPEVMKQLREANVQSIMLTGDNLYTGIHIARKSGLLLPDKQVLLGVLDKAGNVTWQNEEDEVEVERPDVNVDDLELSVELCMSGDAWRVLLTTDKEYATTLAPFCRVFGRCSPLDKVSVVDTFTSLNCTTFMCGDGGNDCGALRAAHIGLALSDSEASIVAPLTSLTKDIADVLKVLKQGRGAMASTIAAYKYVIAYAFLTSGYAQLFTFTNGVSFSEWMWFFIDVVWMITFTLSIPLAKPASKLSKARPTSSLLSLQTMGGSVGVVVINIVFQTIAHRLLLHQDWYQCRNEKVQIATGAVLSASDNYEVSVLFLMLGFQLISVACSLNFGFDYREAWYRNFVFAALFIGFATIHIVITVHPGNMSCLWRVNCDNDHIVRGITSTEPSPIGNFFNSTIMPLEFRLSLLGIMLTNFAAVLVFEFFVVNGWWHRRRLSSKELAAPSVKE